MCVCVRECRDEMRRARLVGNVESGGGGKGKMGYLYTHLSPVSWAVAAHRI